jgi:hypothetical protein
VAAWVSRGSGRGESVSGVGAKRFMALVYSN